MAKQIIIQRVGKGPGGDDNVSYLFWLAVVSGREVPMAGAVSAWGGASGAENTAIAAGSVIEEAYSRQYPVAATMPQIRADLLARFTARQAEVAALPDPNKYNGRFYDPSTGGWQ